MVDCGVDHSDLGVAQDWLGALGSADCTGYVDEFNNRALLHGVNVDGSDAAEPVNNC